MPACTAPWDSQLPDGVRHEYQAVLQRWPGAAAHIDEEFREYLNLEQPEADAGGPQIPGPSLAEQEEDDKIQL